VREDQASQTARGVAAQRRHFERVAADYGDAAADQRLHDDVAGDLPLTDSPLTAYLIARTRFYDQAVVDAVARGCPQVVVVGAGYDGRSLRYAAPSVRWFELDHPATLADKSARLARLGLTADAATTVAVDFDVDDVGEALAAAGHDAAAASLIICEGVTPYLNRRVVIRLLASLRGHAAAGSVLAIDFALTPESEAARLSREELHALVAAVGEPFAFEIPKTEVGGLLRGAGWDLQSALDTKGVEMTSSQRPSAFVTATPAHAGAQAHPMVQLRPMTAAEFDVWRSPLVLSYAADHVRVGNWKADEAPAMADAQLTALLPQGVDTPGMLVFVGENAAGQPVGHLWLALGRRPGAGFDVFIYEIEVDAQQRGQGYGRELLRAAEAEAVKHGASAIGLNVFGDNHVARNLYESAGYASTTIEMRKNLTGGEAP
jgi:methyltransferase (TIGR00027 family)